MKCLHGLAQQYCAICLRTARPWTYPRKPGYTGRVQSTTSLHAAYTLNTKAGVLTICAVCAGLASDHTQGHSKERTAKLVSLIRTGLCKDCGGPFIKEAICPKTGEPHRRKWLIRAMKVPCCIECAGQAEYEVESYVLAGLPNSVMDVWRAQLAEKGMLL